MRTETLYICDYCGATFDNEEDCQEHEELELAERVNGKIRYFDYAGKELPITANPANIDYFWVADGNAFEYVDNYFCECDYAAPGLDTMYRKGNFYYDGDVWKNVEELRNYLIEIQHIFKNCEKVD